MIIREWRARARPTLAGAYVNHFRASVLPELLAVPGFRGATLTQRTGGNFVQFLVLTRWVSTDAIRAFAGSDLEKAVIDPAAEAVLDAFDVRALHYEVIEEVSSAEAETRGAADPIGHELRPASAVTRAVLVPRN